MKIEDAENFLKNGKTLEEFVGKIDWKNFEKFVKEIFSVNGFNTFSNFRFKTERRFEIDVIAAKNNIVFLTDCKEWDKGRYKKSGLSKAAEEQIERTKEFKKFVRKNLIAKSRFKVGSNVKTVSLIVTWYDEDVSQFANCFVVPVWKLNSFLIGHDFY